MDGLTQALLGATVAEAGFRHRLGARAPWFGAACGVVPDLDGLLLLFDDWTSLVHHRGASHSLLVLPWLALPLGALGSRWLGGRRDLAGWTRLAFWALVTHPLLDVFTSFGTQLLAPVSRTRFALDGVAVVDVLFTGSLVFALVRARRADPERGRRLVRRALAWVTTYLLLGSALSTVARGTFDAELRREGFQPEAIRALVSPGLPLTRRVVARDVTGELRLAVWSPFGGLTRRTRLARDDDPRIQDALRSPRGRQFQWFADGFVHATVTRAADGTASVTLSDQRLGFFVDPAVSMFSVVVEFGADGTMTEPRLAPRPSLRVTEELAEGWRLTLAGE